MKKMLYYLIFLVVILCPFNVLAEEPVEKAELETLTVGECDSCKLSPSFNKGITFYMVTTKTDKIKISATGSNGATVSGTGVMSLTKESETFEVKVTTTSGVSTTYKIKVNKEKAPDVTLKSLTLDKGILSPEFSSNNTSYTATVDSDKVTITATPTDETAILTGAGVQELKYGVNDINVKVTARDGSSKSYLIKITRPDNRNTNAYLKSLTINDEDIEFEKDILEYTYKVGPKIEKLKIDAVSEQETSKVEISGNEKFVEGENIVTIKVTAEDGKEKIYTIKVIKEKLKKDEGSNEETTEDEPGLYLKKLEIEGYKIKFDKEKYEYELTIKEEKQLNINASVYDGYNIEITGNESLQEGSIIKIIVTDSEGESVIYKIKIKVDNTPVKEEKIGETNYIPIIMVSLLSVLALVDLVFLFKKLKKK
jgi:hypothetical protein